MATSKYAKKTKAIRRVASGTAVGGKQLRLALNRDFLIAEHKVNVSVSQAYTGVPTSVDVRDFIDTVALETSDGRRVFLTGAQAYDLARYTESASGVIQTLAATSLANYAFEVHHENDGALLDLLTALRSNELTTLDLVITFAADALNGFKGGTVPLVATYNVDVESYDYEMLDETQYGMPLGAFKHFSDTQTKDSAASGAQPDFDLITGCATRFLVLHAYDESGAVPTLSDAIVGNLRINIRGRDFRVTDFASVRQDNVSRRGFNQVGVCVIDFGDDEMGWLDLRSVNQAKIKWDKLVATQSRVTLAQDYTVKD